MYIKAVKSALYLLLVDCGIKQEPIPNKFQCEELLLENQVFYKLWYLEYWLTHITKTYFLT